MNSRKNINGLCVLCSHILQYATLLAAFVFPMVSAHADMHTGMQWLQAQVQASGALSDEASSVALPLQSRSETARTFETLGTTPSAALLRAVGNASAATTVEFLTRRALALKSAGGSTDAMVSALTAMQNADGGFGATEGFTSNPLDTAWALLTIQSNASNDLIARSAVAWLINNRQANGSWISALDENAVIPTALAVQALQNYRAYFGVRTAQTAARSWLAEQKLPDQSWGSVVQTAQALLALLPGQSNAGIYDTTISQLEVMQFADGSWLNDSYVTALVLRALWLNSQAPQATDPAQSSLEVSVTYLDTTQPAVGARVSLHDKSTYQEIYSTFTDAAGVAHFSDVDPGLAWIWVGSPVGSKYSEYAGYLNAEFQPGIHYRISTTVIPWPDYSGRVRGHVIDAETRQPIPGAEVRVEANLDWKWVDVTDEGGAYEVGLVPVNLLYKHHNVSATAAGYMRFSDAYELSDGLEIDIPLHRVASMPASAETLRAVALRHPVREACYMMGYISVIGAPGTIGYLAINNQTDLTAFHIGSSGVAEIRVPVTIYFSLVNQVLDEAMLVYANNPISAYFYAADCGVSDATHLLDTSALGTRYRVLNWNRATSMRKTLEMSFTAINDGTIVTVTPSASANHPSNSPFEIQLGKGQSYIYQVADNNEMTGTVIESNKPVAVFSGAKTANIPFDDPYYGHLLTQLPPIKHWASEYVIPKTANAGAAGNVVRILSDQDGNDIFVNGEKVAALDAGEFYQYDFSGDLSIKSKYPSLVGQFMKSGGTTTWGYLGAPAFAFIPGIEQAKRGYKFVARAYSYVAEEYHVNVAILSAALPSLLLNNNSIDTTDFRSIQGTAYSAGNVLVPTGVGTISASVPFVATLSGFGHQTGSHTFMGANYSPGVSIVGDIVADIVVATDRPAYSVGTSALLSGSVENKGVSSAYLMIQMQVEDANGNLVEKFDEKDLGLIAPGKNESIQQPWNTAKYAAGTYNLVGYLHDSDGNAVNVASTLFDIEAGISANASASISVATDKFTYAPDDRVFIKNLVRNLTTNAAIDDARVELTVTALPDKTVLTQSVPLGQVSAGGMRALERIQLLQNAALGEYVVTAVLYGSGHALKSASAQQGSKARVTDAKLASASTTYVVAKAADIGIGTNPGANADYAVAVTALTPSVSVGDVGTWQIDVTNNGPQDGNGVMVQNSLPAGLIKANWTCTASGQAACGASSGNGDIRMDVAVYAGASDRITIILTGEVSRSGELISTASITPINGGTDADAANNSSSGRVTVAVVSGVSISNVPGTVSIDKTLVVPGDLLTRTDLVRNSGIVALDHLQISRVLRRVDTGDEIQRVEQIIALPAGGRQSWPDVPVDTSALAYGDYAVILIAQLGAEQAVLDERRFTVQASSVNPPSAPTPIPVNSPMTLIAMALGLLALVGRVAHAERMTGTRFKSH